VAWLCSIVPAFVALWLSHITLVRTEVTQVTTILLGPVENYEICVQQIEGKGKSAFHAKRPLEFGCYGEAHSLWNALASAAELAGAVQDNRRRMSDDEAHKAERKDCSEEVSFSDCAERITHGMHACRANIRHDSLDGEYYKGNMNSFSKDGYATWLEGLRTERDECLSFVSSVERSIKKQLSNTNWLR
jgi:hypothetical protein